MKKTALLLAAIALGFTTKAQKGNFIIESGFTFPNFSQSALKSLDYEINSTGSSSQLNFGYFISDKISVSLGINTSTASSKAKDVYDYLGNYKYSYSYELSLLSILAHINYNYIATEKWNINSGIGIGSASAIAKATVTPSSFTQPALGSAGGFAYQIKAIEAKYYPAKWIGIHANLGLGYEGLLGFGGTFRF